ncbi:hypothetical protein Cgig2_030945 [Carnegiea gigantea]|uniref:Uncharacterized protein n=1 Tax=Carnegiea gigantea TaxID=171969 RepID=A0A9Q1JJH0_9CARY|nr:hypothetical protein Cgig2_030945 [Carnegiea gigantea]
MRTPLIRVQERTQRVAPAQQFVYRAVRGSTQTNTRGDDSRGIKSTGWYESRRNPQGPAPLSEVTRKKESHWQPSLPDETESKHDRIICVYHKDGGHTTSKCHKSKKVLKKLANKGQLNKESKTSTIITTSKHGKANDVDWDMEVIAIITGGVDEKELNAG